MFTPQCKVRIFRKVIHSFHFFGAIGFFLGLIVGVGMAYATSIAIWPVVLCGLAGAGILFGLTYLYKIIMGREGLVYYQHEIVILACCFLLLFLLHLPVLKYLDITLMGIGIFLVFGRMGCFSVGCCHGKIGKNGVKYTHAHVVEGFQKHFAGIPVLPVQLIESACVLITVLGGSYAILNNNEPGTALLLYTVVYGAVRFTLEYFRGDTERPYWLDFSEAQWTTLGIFMVSVVLSLCGLLPYYWWHLWALPVLILGMSATVSVRRFRPVPTHKILHPKYILELAEDIEVLEGHMSTNGQVHMLRTSVGLNISRGMLTDTNGIAIHYTFSGEIKKGGTKKGSGFKMNEELAKILGGLIQTLKHPEVRFEIVQGESCIFHIVFRWHTNENQKQVSKSEALKLRRNLRHSYN